MKKVLFGLVLLFGSASVAFATTPQTAQISTLDASSTPYIANVTPDSLNGSTAWLIGFDASTGVPSRYYLNRGFENSGGEVNINHLSPSQTDGLAEFIGDTDAYETTNTANVSGITSTISSLLATVGAIGPTLNIAAFMGSNASTSPYIASSTQNGFMSFTDKAKLDGLASRVATTSTRSIVTGTGATGFQVSSTRDAEVRYSSTIVTTSSIAGSQNGTVVLEIASTDSATPAAWSEIGRCTNGTSYTLAVAIQGVSTQACQITGYVPAGYYAKIRSINNSGTPTYTYNSGQEVLQ